MKTEKITIEPFHCTSNFNPSDFKFELTFIGRRQKGDNRVEITIKFSFWWVKYLRRELRKIVGKAQEQINEVNNGQ